MLPGPSTATVEAVEADIKAGGVILAKKFRHKFSADNGELEKVFMGSTYDGIKALGAVFAVNRLVWTRWAQLYDSPLVSWNGLRGNSV